MAILEDTTIDKNALKARNIPNVFVQCRNLCDISTCGFLSSFCNISRVSGLRPGRSSGPSFDRRRFPQVHLSALATTGAAGSTRFFGWGDARQRPQYRHRECRIRLGEIEHLPIADNTTDVVISNCAINLVPDKAYQHRQCPAPPRRPHDRSVSRELIACAVKRIVHIPRSKKGPVFNIVNPASRSRYYSAEYSLTAPMPECCCREFVAALRVSNGDSCLVTRRVNNRCVIAGVQPCRRNCSRMRSRSPRSDAMRGSSSASSLAPTRTTTIESHIQVIKPTIAPSSP